ncbi:MAG TPA: A24 family peptidase [Caulobacteraceae bacterium]|jgi:leader peptidase (prepilin peptidase)/N-methyltransferase
MTTSLPGVLMLFLAGSVAGPPIAWGVSRFDGAASAPRAWIAAALPLILLLEAAFAPRAHWLAGGILAGILLMIASVDALTLHIPDLLSVPLAAIGLFLGSPGRTSLGDGLLGAAVGFLVLAGLSWAYRTVRGREGLGLGDAKLLGAGGAWVGWQGLPTILLVAAGVGFLTLAVRTLRRGRDSLTEGFAFGPALAAGVWLAWLLAARQGTV